MDRLSMMEIFVAIGERGSLAAAARARGQAPSSVTMALRKLEETVGVRLVQRTTRRLHLTPEGEHFLEDCRRILAGVETALERISPDGSLRGPVRLTTTHDFGRVRLPELIDEFLLEHPGVSVELNMTDSVSDLVESGFDFAIRTGPLSDSRLKSRLLLRNERRVCAAPEYWCRHGRPQHPRELEEHNCLVLAREGAPQSTWHFREGTQQIAVPVQGNRLANDGGVLRQWAVRGAGVVLKSAIDIAEDLAAGRLETALDDYCTLENNLYVIQPADARPPARVEALLQYLQRRLVMLTPDLSTQSPSVSA